MTALARLLLDVRTAACVSSRAGQDLETASGRLPQAHPWRDARQSAAAEPVVLAPQCAECHQLWLPDDEERWRSFWVDDGPDEVLVFYFRWCAERKFGSD